MYFLLLPIAALCPSPAPAQAAADAPNLGRFDGTDLHRVEDIADAQWLVRGGDDPQWARADYNDSHWQLLSTEDDLRNAVGAARPPVVWYRLHLKVSPTEHGLSLAQYNAASAFEVYSNGVLLMRGGSVSPYRGVTAVYTQSIIPRSQVQTGAVVVAVRVAFSRGEWLGSHPGLGPGNILLGYTPQLDERRHYRVLVESVSQWFSAGLGIVVGLIAFGLYLVERRRQEYLWAFLFGIGTALYLCLDLARDVYAVPLLWYDVLIAVLGSLPTVAALRFVWATLGRRAGIWINLYQAALLALPPVLYIGFDQGWLPYKVLVFTLLPLAIPTAIVLPIVTARDGYRGNREAWLLMVPLLLAGFNTYVQFTGYVLPVFGATSAWLDSFIARLDAMAVGSLTVSFDTVTTTLALCAIVLIIVLRTNRISRQLSRSAAELEAARSVQSMLLSRERIATPGFAVESVYRPAAEVGGDFFLISPGDGGSLMVAVGDVSGKGLAAALRVSLILGALQREPSRRPREVLAGLNKVLCGHSDGGFTTCGCALLSADGKLTLANAGHLSPYRNGFELAVDGGLPLGVVADAEYSETTYDLKPAETLMYLSDGVVEARNAKGELLGFERVEAISEEGAAEIADAAQKFGQDDDITVVTITRLAVPGLA